MRAFLHGLLFLSLPAVCCAQQRPGRMATPPPSDTLYPDAPERFHSILMEHIRIPNGFVDSGWTDRIVIRFLVREDGNLSDVTVVRSTGGKSFDDEVIRVVKMSQPWKPAFVHNRPVAMWYTLPIAFHIDHN